jgi:hypothetical protein
MLIMTIGLLPDASPTRAGRDETGFHCVGTPLDPGFMAFQLAGAPGSWC